MAFYLEQENGEKFWGTANNLQDTSFSAYDYTREVFFQNVDLNRLNPDDRDILIRGLSERDSDA